MHIEYLCAMNGNTEIIIFSFITADFINENNEFDEI